MKHLVLAALALGLFACAYCAPAADPHDEEENQASLSEIICGLKDIACFDPPSVLLRPARSPRRRHHGGGGGGGGGSGGGGGGGGSGGGGGGGGGGHKKKTKKETEEDTEEDTEESDE